MSLEARQTAQKKKVCIICKFRSETPRRFKQTVGTSELLFNFRGPGGHDASTWETCTAHDIRRHTFLYSIIPSQAEQSGHPEGDRTSVIDGLRRPA